MKKSLVTILVGAGVVWFALRTGARLEGEGPSPLETTYETAAPAREPAPEIDVRRAESPGATVEVPVSASVSEDEASVATAAGVLRLRVHDSETWEPVERLRLRAISRTRLASAEVSSPVELRLTPGQYDLLLLAPRYDPLALGRVQIEADDVTDLGNVSMKRGLASLGGVVFQLDARVSRHLDVALFGQGRNPCAACPVAGPAAIEADPPAPCVVCGYARERSVLRRASGEAFGFRALASGEYRLVVSDPEAHILAQRRVELAPEASEWIEIDLRFGDLAVEITGPDGEPFDGVWSEEGQRFAGPIRLFFLRERILCGGTIIEPPAKDLPRGDAYERTAPRSPSPVAGGDAPQVEGERGEPGPADRPLRSGEGLWPSVLAPPASIRTAPLAVRRQGPGRFAVSQVAGDAESLVVCCGPYYHAAKLGAEHWLGRPVQIALTSRCTVSSRLLQGSSSSCTSCHDLPLDLLR